MQASCPFGEAVVASGVAVFASKYQ